MKPPRRKAREDALQILYQIEINEGLTPASALLHFERSFSAGGEPVDAFTSRLVTGVTEKTSELDEEIEKASENWRMDRMAAVDRNILRLGAYELLWCDEIPSTVTINEMIEIAKQFGTEDSPSFVNGILDRIRQNVSRPLKAP